jgi:hypothetical protein
MLGISLVTVAAEVTRLRRPLKRDFYLEPDVGSYGFVGGTFSPAADAPGSVFGLVHFQAV